MYLDVFVLLAYQNNFWRRKLLKDQPLIIAKM